MASEVTLGTGYIELAARDRGAVKAISDVRRAMNDAGQETERFAARSRTALAATNSAIQGLGSAALSGSSPMQALSRGILGVTSAAGGMAGPIGAVAGIVATLIGLGLSKWFSDSADAARDLATAMNAIGESTGAARGATLASQAASGPFDVAMVAARSIGPARAELGAAQAAFAGTQANLDGSMSASQAAAFRRQMAASRRVEGASAGVEQFNVNSAVELAGLNLDASTSGASLEDRVRTYSRMVELLKQVRDVNLEASKSEPPGQQYERFVEAFQRADAKVGSAEANLAGYAARLAEARAEAEAVAKANEDAADAARRFATDATSQMREAFSQPNPYAAELDAVQRHAQGVRDGVLVAEAERQRRAREDVGEVRGGNVVDLISGLRSLQAGIFGSDKGPEAQTAKHTAATATAAAKTAEQTAKANEHLAAIAKSVSNGVPATLG